MSLRVAAYCRVSTDQEDQVNSLSNQREYFERYIKSQPDWRLVEVFADEGLSGTSSRTRPAFQKMIAQARNGEIDLILTKEVSRFARNTVDALAHTRELRRLGVGVLFLNDNIDTRENDGEFRLTIMASVAQEESRKTSERVKWGQRRAMENGVVFGNHSLYGYELQNGRLTVDSEQAAVVRRIYHKFIDEGKGTHVIARELYEEGIAPPSARDKPWSSTMILRILRNEKYCGDLLQHKYMTPDYLDHKKVLNDGSEKTVLLRDHHEAIITREQFERVQAELERRAPSDAQKVRYSNRYWCSGKLICGGCGARFVPRKRTRPGGSTYFYWACHAKAHFGRRKLDAQGRAVGCGMRVINHQSLCAIMAYLTELLRLDWERLAEEVLDLLRQTERTDGAGERERLEREREQLLSKKDAILDAYFEQTITKEELERLRGRYDKALERCEDKLHALSLQAELRARQQAETERLRRLLRTETPTAEALYGELLEQMVIHEESVSVKLYGLPLRFLVRYQTSGKGEAYRTEITSCEIET